MFRLFWTISVHSRYYLRRYMPSNRLLDAIRRRRGLRWGIPAMLIAAPYLLIASICTRLIDDGGPGWLHLVVFWAIWNAMKSSSWDRSASPSWSVPGPRKQSRGAAHALSRSPTTTR